MRYSAVEVIHGRHRGQVHACRVTDRNLSRTRLQYLEAKTGGLNAELVLQCFDKSRQTVPAIAYNLDLEAIASRIRVHEEIRGFISEQRLEAIPDPPTHGQFARLPLEKHDEFIGQSAQKQAEIWCDDDYFSDEVASEGDIEIANDPSLAEYDNLESGGEEAAIVGPARNKGKDLESDVESRIRTAQIHEMEGSEKLQFPARKEISPQQSVAQPNSDAVRSCRSCTMNTKNTRVTRMKKPGSKRGEIFISSCNYNDHFHNPPLTTSHLPQATALMSVAVEERIVSEASRGLSERARQAEAKTRAEPPSPRTMSRVLSKPGYRLRELSHRELGSLTAEYNKQITKRNALIDRLVKERKAELDAVACCRSEEEEDASGYDGGDEKGDDKEGQVYDEDTDEETDEEGRNIADYPASAVEGSSDIDAQEVEAALTVRVLKRKAESDENDEPACIKRLRPDGSPAKRILTDSRKANQNVPRALRHVVWRHRKSRGHSASLATVFSGAGRNPAGEEESADHRRRGYRCAHNTSDKNRALGVEERRETRENSTD
ncbi:hypothetical protein DFH11DRAFT_1543316 [Phellopilus nigrolimitatus]|nr:hypothetical protein DFH11DRAFT_1543316 [Phellopilus nigrolimitatus]